MTDAVTPPADAIDASVADSSSYDLLKKRLMAQGDQLLAKTQQLNRARIEQFGQREQHLLMRTRARTEHNAVARDLVYIGNSRAYPVPTNLSGENSIQDIAREVLRLIEQDKRSAGL